MAPNSDTDIESCTFRPTYYIYSLDVGLVVLVVLVVKIVPKAVTAVQLYNINQLRISDLLVHRNWAAALCGSRSWKERSRNEMGCYSGKQQ